MDIREHICIHLQTCLEVFWSVLSMRDLRLRAGNEFLKDSLMPDMVLKRKRELLWMELVRAGFADVPGSSQTLIWWAGGEGTMSVSSVTKISDSCDHHGF